MCKGQQLIARVTWARIRQPCGHTASEIEHPNGRCSKFVREAAIKSILKGAAQVSEARDCQRLRYTSKHRYIFTY